jgi:alpha-1,2-mannosyltransferase
LLALLFGDASMYLWTFAGLLASSVMMAMIILRCRPGLYPTLLLVMPFMAIQAVSGNVNALLIPACALVWWATARGRPGMAGALIGLAFALKLTPGLWIWWFIVRRDSRALVTCLATVAAAVAVSCLAVSPDSFTQYLAVAREAGTVGLPGMSPASLATSLGVPVAIANLVPYLLAACAAALAWLWRDRPAWAFAACAVGVTLGTPDLRAEVLSWLVLVIVPFANDRGPWFWRRRVLLGTGETTAESGKPVM